MAVIGHFSSMDKAVIYSLKHAPEKWTLGDFNRVLTHDGGLQLVKQISSNRWVITKPIGFVSLRRKTCFIIDIMIFGKRFKD